MKKLIISILTVCLCLTSVFVLTSCEEEQKGSRVDTATVTEPDVVDDDGFGYIIVDSKTVMLTQYTGSAEDVSVPSEYEGMPVTEIGEGAFRSTKVTSVTVPNSVTSIGVRAFSNCQKLTSVILPDGIKTIEQNAFDYCSNLKTIKLPNTLETIGMYCFTVSGLESIEIPESVTYIDHYAFYQCLNLETAIVPATVKEFGQNVFSGNDKLTITGPSGSAIEDYAKEYELNFTAE
ncbi:MAG: leucine-rich repeat domain-containing protein [Ruminococcus sp.]|nr:leucine-rich repeat domain-containing protein [Ruminococcus sp.]